MALCGTALLGCMTDRLNIVTIRVKNEGAIVVRMVLRAQPWCPIVTTTRRKGGVVKRVDQGSAAHLKSNMNGRIIGGALANPEIRFLRFAKPRHVRVPSHSASGCISGRASANALIVPKCSKIAINSG